MPELETSRELSRAEVAAYLREFADELDRRGDDTTTQHGETHGTGTTDRTTDARMTGTDADSRTSPTDATDASTTAEANTEETAETTTDAATDDTAAADVTADDTTGADADRSDSTTGYRKVTFLVGNDSATINPPETVAFDVAVDSDSSLMETGTRERVDFSIAWNADDVPEDDELRIE
ncbi:hypothetical protein [Haloprofundus halobius]|uniref:hypothetical protein n=1 Tax=Haloprofundus halobius TaxID=2876194 RepID=UPI001CCFE022|nr:hypothetical protein [Haloprofundus halobius]